MYLYVPEAPPMLPYYFDSEMTTFNDQRHAVLVMHWESHEYLQSTRELAIYNPLELLIALSVNTVALKTWRRLVAETIFPLDIW